MAAYGGSFESAVSIEERKAFKREAREEILHQAKQKYEEEEQRKALRKARGEDTWMLPDVDQRLQQLGQENSDKKKKREKKSKKSKREKKKKVKKEKRKKALDSNASSDSTGEEEEEEWVEASPLAESGGNAWKIPDEATPTASSANSNQRDEWMTFDFLTMRTTSTAERRADKEREKEAIREKTQAIEQAGLHKLELNPFWKEGGTGLPPEDRTGAAVKKASVVEDGGLSWLRKSYQRMKEQAEREQRSLDTVVAERYGSVEEFQRRLREAEEGASGGGRGPRRTTTSPHLGRDREQRQEESRDRGSERRHEERRDWSSERRREERRDWGSERHREERRDRDRERHQKPGRDQGRDWDRNKDRDHLHDNRSVPEQERRSRNEKGRWEEEQNSQSSLSSLKPKFLKPSDTVDDHGPFRLGMTREAAPGLSKHSSAFQKIHPDDDDDDGPRPWKKSSLIQEEADMTMENREQPHPAVPAEHRQSGAALLDTALSSCKSTATELSSDSEEEKEEETVSVLSDDEMNKLGAKLVKAELMGNTTLVEKLKAQLRDARKAKENHTVRATVKSDRMVSERVADEEELLLFRTDQSGCTWPVNAPSQPVEPRGGRRKRQAIQTHEDGKRVRYFEDDDGVEMRELVRREKMTSAADQNARCSRMLTKMMGRQDGENYTLDDMFVTSAAQRERSGQEEERQRSRAIQESRRLATQMEKCPHCFSSPQLSKHLLIAIGTKVYLSLPATVSLTEGHCLITPLQHHCSATDLDEDVWAEIQLFRRALVKMFDSQGLDCVFMETHINPKSRRHMLYECVPLPRELGDMAPIYFKKAIQESDEEWAMNKKVVDLSAKDIRRSVPRGLPYFSVDFGLQGGFAHVIENQQMFPHYFGKEVLGGMLDLEPRRWRKPPRENFDDQRKKVLQFAQWWRRFDCTKTSS
ncbi:CWF19-like protein 2 [Chanos chanos]|uniref:CWF19-like protein 2 n=1 Tax=Chanos chanos TaxID=29144 RepID=A0A6J2VJ99_CHACN|nr:CWF19-like protein 2 [Chanos chanos]